MLSPLLGFFAVTGGHILLLVLLVAVVAVLVVRECTRNQPPNPMSKDAGVTAARAQASGLGFLASLFKAIESNDRAGIINWAKEVHVLVKFTGGFDALLHTFVFEQIRRMMEDGTQRPALIEYVNKLNAITLPTAPSPAPAAPNPVLKAAVAAVLLIGLFCVPASAATVYVDYPQVFHPTVDRPVIDRPVFTQPVFIQDVYRQGAYSRTAGYVEPVFDPNLAARSNLYSWAACQTGCQQGSPSFCNYEPSCGYYYGQNGWDYPVLRWSGRVLRTAGFIITAPIRAWVRWAPLRRLFGRW